MKRNSSYDLILVHEKLSTMPDEEVFGLLEALFPEHGLYRVSFDWRQDKGYILKAKGTKGDVIVGWIENQSNCQQLLKHCPIF